jgi:hypothetical protein
MSDPRPVRVSALVWPFLLMAVSLGAADSASPVTSRRSGASPWITEAVKAKLPKYAPPKEEDASVESTGAAEMKDNILHLPTMTVRQSAKTSAEIVNWLTPAGRLGMGLKRYPGTKIGNILGLNNPWALARLREDIEVERKDAIKQRGQAVLIEDTPSDRETAQLLKAALMPINRD